MIVFNSGFRTLVGLAWVLLLSSLNAQSGPREVFWGTPNFSYAAKSLPPESLAGLGVNYMSHLIYWKDYESSKNQWDEKFVRKQKKFLDELSAQGIRSGIRLGEAHPGATVWKTENGKPYLGRNREVYPGDQDTDEKYFRYLARLAREFRGKVDHYVLGDELDMIYGASFRNQDRLREYFEFFRRAAAVIAKEDPAAKIVVFPFAWGETVKNAEILNSWGLEKIADGFCLNMARTDCTSSDYLSDIAAGIKKLSPKYGLYSNGFGYLSNLMSEESQAVELAHVMIRIWRAGWNYLPYYTLANNAHSWSTGLYEENLVKGGIVPRQALGVFKRLSALLARHPRLDSGKFQVLGLETPFGMVETREFPSADIMALWQSDAEGEFGILQFSRSGDPRILPVKVAIPDGGPEAILQVVNVIGGTVSLPEFQRNAETGQVVVNAEVRNEPQVFRWINPS